MKTAVSGFPMKITLSSNFIALLLFICFSFSAQTQSPRFSGALVYNSSEKDLYIWTENLEKDRINLRIGTKEGKVIEQRIIPGVSTEKIKAYSYIHPKNNQLYVFFHPDWENIYAKNTSVLPYYLFIIDIETKKIKKTITLANVPEFRMFSLYIYPEKNLWFMETNGFNPVKFLDLSKDSLEVIPGFERLSFCFNEYAILRKNVVDKKETVWSYVLYDINNKKAFDKPLDYNESKGGKAIDFNGRMLIELKDEKDRIYYEEVNLAKQKLSKEKVDNPVSNPNHNALRPSTPEAKDFDLIKYNFNAFLNTATIDEKFAFASLMASEIDQKYRNNVEIEYMTQVLTDLISKHAKDTRNQRWLEWIYKQNKLSNLTQINLIQIAVDNGIIDDKLFATVFKHYNEKTNGLLDSKALKEGILKFARKGLETITFSDYTDRLITKYEIALLEIYLENSNTYNEYLKIDKQAKKQDTSAVISFLANYEGKIPKILTGQLYYELAESKREIHEKTQDSLSKIQILKLYENAVQNEFDSDEYYVGYMRALLFMMYDFAKADAVLTEFMQKYGELPQAKKWFTNYPFNAGVSAFKIGNYDLTISYLNTYLKNDNKFQKDASLRLFEAAMHTMNWEEAAKAVAFLKKELDKNELEAYFPDFERWISCLETKDPTLLPQKSNVYLMEENQNLYTEAKKGLSTGNSSFVKKMEKQALFFDSLQMKNFAKEAWIEIGSFHFKRSDYEEAEKTYLFCMERMQTDFECHKNYIITLIQQEKTNEAKEKADSLIALYPNDPNIRKACGQVYNFYASESTQYGNDSKTIELFEKSLSYDENEVTCLFLAYFYQKTGKSTKRDEMIKRARAVNPNVFNDYPDFKTLLGM